MHQKESLWRYDQRLPYQILTVPYIWMTGWFHCWYVSWKQFTVEVNRSLYMNEETGTRLPEFAHLKADIHWILEKIIDKLWGKINPFWCKYKKDSFFSTLPEEPKRRFQKYRINKMEKIVFSWHLFLIVIKLSTQEWEKLWKY